MKAWLKGGVIGLIVSIVLLGLAYTLGMFLASFLIGPYWYFLKITGFDYIAAFFASYPPTNSASQNWLIIIPIISIAVGSFLGFFFQKDVSLKKKIILLIVIILLLAPLSGYSSFLKIRDEKLSNLICVAKENCEITLTNEKTCEKISHFHPRSRDNCYADVALINDNPSTCDKIEGLDAKRFCYTSLTIKLKDISICYQNNDMKDSCIISHAVEFGDISLCMDLENQGVKNSCYYQVAIYQLKDISICDKIQYNSRKSTKDNCYRKLAESIEDCEKVVNAKIRDDCYGDLSKQKEDSSICENIVNENTKVNCEGNARRGNY